MAWYAKVSHPRIIPPDEGSPPRPTPGLAYRGGACQRDVGHIDDHRGDVQMSDGALAMSDQLSREELLQVLTQISSTGRPALMYQIVRQRRGHKYRRQQG